MNGVGPRRLHRPFDVTAEAGIAHDVPILIDDATTDDRVRGPAGDVTALVDGVVRCTLWE